MLKDAWDLAIKTLSIMELQKLSERLALAKTAKQLGIKNAETIRHAYGLVVETVRRKNLIFKFIKSVAGPTVLEVIPLEVLAFLQLYVYQTRFASNSLVVNLQEAQRICSLARTLLGWKTLRPVERYLGYLLTRNMEQVFGVCDDAERIALKTYQPVWFAKYCFRLFGRQEALGLLEGSIFPPPVYIRLNSLKASEEATLQELRAEGVQLEEVEQLQDVYKLKKTRLQLRTLSSFKNGQFCVQDKASCYAAKVANPRSGQTVLDICAAPGSKTSYLAQLMQNNGKIYSVDYSVRRLGTWKKEVDRMGVDIAEPLVFDARCSLPLEIEVDLALLDPPCTSTGVFGRQPSAKWRLTPKSIEIMAGIQWKMINTVAEKIKKGGFLIYSTCSVTIEENEMIIERFLKWHPEFMLLDAVPKMGVPGLNQLHKCRRLYPNIHETNGFFLARLVRL